jgi:hypothetical protein
MALSGLSLNAAAAVGPGEVITFDQPVTRLAMQVLSTGSPTSYFTELQISLDGINFVNWAGNSNDGLVQATPVPPCIAARANLTILVGGTNPTVSAFIRATY